MAHPTPTPRRASATWATSSTSAPRTGQIYVTQDGGGSGTSNNWLNISLGLDGSPVESIITDPTRGSHDAYAVTTTGVFYLADSILLGEQPHQHRLRVGQHHQQPPQTWPTPSSARPTTRRPTRTRPSYNQAVSLSSIVADWRYTIPNAPNDPNGPGYHPVLYVGAGNSSGTGSGVYQSLDDGQTWTLFPDTTYGAVVRGRLSAPCRGHLPQPVAGQHQRRHGYAYPGRSLCPGREQSDRGLGGRSRHPHGRDLRPRRVRHQPGAADPWQRGHGQPDHRGNRHRPARRS